MREFATRTKVPTEERHVYHVIETCDVGRGMMFDIHIPGVSDGNVWDAIRECMGRIGKSDVGRTLRFTVRGQKVRCQVSSLKGK